MLLYNNACADLFRWCSTEVVQLIRNQQVVGSIPTTSSTKSAGIARCLPIFVYPFFTETVRPFSYNKRL